MFLKFQVEDRFVTMSVKDISYYEETETGGLFIVLSSGAAFTTDDHSIQHLEAALNEAYSFVKVVQKKGST